MSLIIIDPDSDPIIHLTKKDKRLAKVISSIGPISYETKGNSYTSLVHSIIEQMLSVSVGNKIYERLESLCGGDITPLSLTALTDEEIRSAGISMSKVRYLRNLTDAVMSQTLVFDDLPNLPDDVVMNKLTALKGIGPWTAKMYMIFVLDRRDVLPYEDLTFLSAYKWLYKTEDTSVPSVKKKCSKWSPYSSIAARYLYIAFDSGMTKEEFHLRK